MYPDLSYFFHDLLGTDPDNWISIFKTFGFMLVMAILSAALLFYVELKRKAGEGFFKATKFKYEEGAPANAGELISNAVFGFLVGFKVVYAILNFDEFQADPAGVILSAKGHWLAGIGLALVFAGMRWWEKDRKKLPKPKIKTRKLLPHDRIGDITVVAAVSGLIGAKIFALIEDLPAFFADPIGAFFSGSGLAIYGGLVGGFVGVNWYLKKHKIPFWPVADAIAPALMVSYAVGRLGCHFSGDGDWGIVNQLAQPGWWIFPDWAWAYDYPRNVLKIGLPIEGCEWIYCSRLPQAVWPTSVYEAVAGVGLGGVLWGLRKRLTIPGTLFFVYLIFNGIERFFIEKIRINDKYDILGMQLTQAEMIAIGLFLIGVGGVIWLRRKGREQTA